MESTHFAPHDTDVVRPLLRVTEAADRLSVSTATAYRWIRNGVLPAVRVGDSIRVDPRELEQYVYGSDGPHTPLGGAEINEGGPRITASSGVSGTAAHTFGDEA